MPKAINLLGKILNLARSSSVNRPFRPLKTHESYFRVGVLLKDGLTVHTRPVDLHRVQGPGKVVAASHRS